MSPNQNFLVVGATGNQGKAVISALLAHPSKISPTSIYAVTRDAYSPSAQRLASRHVGIHLIEGNLSNSVALFEQLPAAVRSTTVSFLMQPEDPEAEHTNGQHFISAAQAAGIAHIVYSSADRGAGSDNDPSFVPQFQGKFVVEQHLKKAVLDSAGSLSYTILRPVFMMENFKKGFLSKVIANLLRDQLNGQKFQMVSNEDIGKWAAAAMVDSRDMFFHNRGFSIAGDELSFDEIDRIYQDETGQHIPTTYWLISAPSMAMVGKVNALFRLLRDVPGGADLPALSARSKPVDFRTWVRSTTNRTA
ncbi:NmrA family protein-like protein [Myriangium duriaei CBS 260.36]|uniref:NmrA family protein-like protein n=1 Tax=Myriangium duriaei CBS 260.36 TaxID=1168546 RepID=A0A9P4IYH7_9PEZI|nr:NmrA family protein-like protein [Myriangium duriaei CBS 260.36]